MKRPQLFLLILIILLGLFFRTYKVVERADFGHDADLFSWIVKDIVVNGHPRLIGQLTSAPGIFIGPLFYYLLVPFFISLNMDPVAANIPITVIGGLAIFSYYFVFSKLFNPKVGLIASFLYALLLTNITFDRQVFPSTLTNLWVIWYFYTILQITRGKYFILPILGILIGLIWNIHIALLPTLTALPLAFIISRKSPSKKQVLYFLVSLSITSIPLIAFELRHSFSQTQSFLTNFSSAHGGETGITKFIKVFNMITRNINSLFLSPQSLPEVLRPIFVVLLFGLTSFISTKKKLISKKEFTSLVVWMIGVISFFTLSSTLVSEYYLYNIEIIFIALTSLTLFFFYNSLKIGKILVLSLFALILLKNLSYVITTEIYHKGYIEKRAIVDYIQKDATKKGFPCFGISYITAPGENVGFRYFFWLKNSQLVHPSLKVPVYNIVIPDELSKEKVEKKFGHIGIISPLENASVGVTKKECQENTNLTDSMFGYVE